MRESLEQRDFSVRHAKAISWIAIAGCLTSVIAFVVGSWTTAREFLHDVGAGDPLALGVIGLIVTTAIGLIAWLTVHRLWLAARGTPASRALDVFREGGYEEDVDRRLALTTSDGLLTANWGRQGDSQLGVEVLFPVWLTNTSPVALDVIVESVAFASSGSEVWLARSRKGAHSERLEPGGCRKLLERLTLSMEEVVKLSRASQVQQQTHDPHTKIYRGERVLRGDVIAHVRSGVAGHELSASGAVRTPTVLIVAVKALDAATGKS